jgi:tetratricopeptide (TPR) repeat protein
MAVLLGYTYADAGLSDRMKHVVLDADDLVRVGRIVRMSERLRNAGQASEAKRELAPTLEELFRAEAAGQRDEDFRLTMLDGLLAYTIINGDLSPEEETSQTIAIAKRAVRVANETEDEAALAHALNALSNQQRIGGELSDAYKTIRRALPLRRGAADHCYSAVMLARIASETGDTATFRRAMRLAWENLERVDRPTAVINPLSIGEIEVRGLLALGRPAEADQRLSEIDGYSATTVAPQWRIILSITAGEIALAKGDEEGGLRILAAAAEAATRQFLPHQLQRIERALERARSEDARDLKRSVQRAISRGDQGLI